MAHKKSFDPLARIPSAKVIREKLQEIQATARRLEILLDVAERIEREAAQRLEVASC